MKRILTFAMGLLVAGTTFGATFQAQELLTVNGIRLDDAAAGTDSGVTNLSMLAEVINSGYTTASNVAGLIITNRLGTSNTVATGTAETLNCLGSGSLFPFTDGQWEGPTWAGTSGQIMANPSTYGQTNQFQLDVVQTSNFKTAQALAVTYTGYSAIDGTVTVVCYPGYRNSADTDVYLIDTNMVWAGTFSPNQVTGTGHALLPVPTYKWPGAERLYLYSITNGDSTAGDDIAIVRVDLIGWRP